MSADPRRPELDFVDLENPDDVAVWTQSFGVSRQELERAVAQVGPSVGRVYDYFGRNRTGLGS